MPLCHSCNGNTMIYLIHNTFTFKVRGVFNKSFAKKKKYFLPLVGIFKKHSFLAPFNNFNFRMKNKGCDLGSKNYGICSIKMR